MNISYILGDILIVYEDGEIRILDVNFDDISKFSLKRTIVDLCILPNNTMICAFYLGRKIIDLETFKQRDFNCSGHLYTQGSKLISVFNNQVEIIH